MENATTPVPSPVAPPPEGVRAGNENLVKLTSAAGGKIRTLAAREKQGDFLRVAITGGGCNGLSYKLKFAAEPRRGDILVQTSGVPVVVDADAPVWKGSVIHSENLGSDTFLFVDIGEKEPVLVRQEGKSAIGLGARIGIRPRSEHLHRFDQAGRPMQA